MFLFLTFFNGFDTWDRIPRPTMVLMPKIRRPLWKSDAVKQRAMVDHSTALFPFHATVFSNSHSGHEQEKSRDQFFDANLIEAGIVYEITDLFRIGQRTATIGHGGPEIH